MIIPPAPGLFSAGGLLAARLERHFVQTLFGRAADVDLAAVNATYEHLEAQARAELAGDRHTAAAIVCHRSADLRYVGQGYELTVPAPSTPLSPETLVLLLEAFGQEHERTYGHRATAEPVEIVNLRVTAHLDQAQAKPLHAALTSSRAEREPRHAYFGPDAIPHLTPVLDRFDLMRDARPGPLIIEEYDATTVVPPGCAARLDEWSNVVIDVS